jgi:hypothetical protein
MNNKLKEEYIEEISLIDIWNFIHRQYIFITIVFLLVAGTAFSYAMTRPTTWESQVSLMVGERLFFIEQQQQQQIEGSAEIVYRYSGSALIKPIKNTRIVEISASAESKELSVENINKIKNEIINNHKLIFEDKKLSFENLMSALYKDGTNKTEIFRVFDNASNSSLTRQLGEVKTIEKAYSGMFLKIFGAGSVLGLFLAFLLALGKDYWGQKSKSAKQ